MSDEGAKLQRYAQIASVFTPGAPIETLSLFAGRYQQILDVVNAISQRGQHVVLYGERGVGKTSLAKVLSQIFESKALEHWRACSINCATDGDFEGLWRAVFRELHIAPSEQEGDLGPEAVRFHLERLAAPTLVIIDELDRLENDEALTLLADTIKTLSDHSVKATLVLVGVADSIDDLVGDHHSVVRALVQVQMPRMSIDELSEIIDKGNANLGMAISADAKTRIATLSEGLPHYTHLLTLHAAQRAVGDDRSEIRMSDIEVAIKFAVEKAQHSIRSAYQKATRSAHKDHLFAEVLLACALAAKDPLGYFTAGGAREPLSRIMGRAIEIPAFARHLKEFTEVARGPILQKTGEKRRHFYRFVDALLQPYVILHGLSVGLITEDLVKDSQAHQTRMGLSVPDSPLGLD